MEYTIEVEIDSDGNIKTVVKGIKGTGCREASAFLDNLGKVTHDSPTAEARQQQCAPQTKQIQVKK